MRYSRCRCSAAASRRRSRRRAHGRTKTTTLTAISGAQHDIRRDSMSDPAQITVADLHANGMTFRVRKAGDTGEPVVLLHGFPETSHMWLQLIPKLVEAGYRCVAPDQRGYSPGARPADVEAYAYRALASDVFALADAAGFDRFHLVGHDWGALVGWAALGVDDAGRI